MTKHTPGPWIVNCCTRRGTGLYRHEISNEEGSDAEVIATVPCPVTSDEPGMDETAGANARLIAAAPDLLAALEELVAEADEHPGWEGHPHSQTAGFQLARAAIAKAKAS